MSSRTTCSQRRTALFRVRGELSSRLSPHVCVERGGAAWPPPRCWCCFRTCTRCVVPRHLSPDDSCLLTHIHPCDSGSNQRPVDGAEAAAATRCTGTVVGVCAADGAGPRLALVPNVQLAAGEPSSQGTCMCSPRRCLFGRRQECSTLWGVLASRVKTPGSDQPPAKRSEYPGSQTYQHHVRVPDPAVSVCCCAELPLMRRRWWWSTWPLQEASGSGLFLVNFYYTHYWFFGYCCVGAETLYLVSPPTLPSPFLIDTSPSHRCS